MPASNSPTASRQTSNRAPRKAAYTKKLTLSGGDYLHSSSSKLLLGMTLTVGGIAWAVLERTRPPALEGRRPAGHVTPAGIALGFGGGLSWGAAVLRW